MDQQILETVVSVKKQVIAGMVEYMTPGNEGDPDYDSEWDAGYQQKDVDKCEKLMDEYQDAIQQSDGATVHIMKAIERLVCGLNKVNLRCDHTLIETDQREDICEFVDKVIVAKGIDIDTLAASQNCGRSELTDPWREW